VTPNFWMLVYVCNIGVCRWTTHAAHELWLLNPRVHSGPTVHRAGRSLFTVLSSYLRVLSLPTRAKESGSNLPDTRAAGFLDPRGSPPDSVKVPASGRDLRTSPLRNLRGLIAVVGDWLQWGLCSNNTFLFSYRTSSYTSSVNTHTASHTETFEGFIWGWVSFLFLIPVLNRYFKNDNGAWTDT